jgi:hypothetical protein
MKKVILFFLMFAVGLMMVSPSFAAKKKTTVTKAKVKQVQKVKPVQVDKKTVQIEEKAGVPVLQKETQDKRGWQVFGGYGGGAGLVKAGYLFPINPGFTLVADAGFGLGNNFSIMPVDVQGVFPLGSNRLGVEITAANYSKAITNVPGVSGTISQGTHMGAGIFFGMPFRNFNVQVGYNTALGVNVGAVYKF